MKGCILNARQAPHACLNLGYKLASTFHCLAPPQFCGIFLFPGHRDVYFANAQDGLRHRLFLFIPERIEQNAQTFFAYVRAVRVNIKCRWRWFHLTRMTVHRVLFCWYCGRGQKPLLTASNKSLRNPLLGYTDICLEHQTGPKPTMPHGEYDMNT